VVKNRNSGLGSLFADGEIPHHYYLLLRYMTYLFIFHRDHSLVVGNKEYKNIYMWKRTKERKVLSNIALLCYGALYYEWGACHSVVHSLFICSFAHLFAHSLFVCLFVHHLLFICSFIVHHSFVHCSSFIHLFIHLFVRLSFVCSIV